jgi:CheY-like chemotaxis protein/anti-sigma regulatory factor (Ser/Thr protein kinase)
MKPELHAFSAKTIFDQLRIEFEPMAREKRLDFKVIACSVPILSDRRLLRRLLRNLVSNAVKYTAPGGRIVVGARRRAGGLRLEVWDTGIGIPEDQQRIIFHEFTRLQSAQQSAPGLGLGLSIVERLGRVLDHPVALRSAPGHGSVFSVQIPNAALDIEVANAMPLRRGARKEAVGGMVVVAIDNDPRILHGMQTLLEQWQCVPICAKSGAEAVRLLHAAHMPPHIILADYHLDDEGNGLDAIARLRALYGSEIPALLITADRTAEVRDRAADEDVYLLYKPLKPASLRALLAQTRVARTAAE